MAEPDFDLFVIGGGSGGVACARRSAGYGAKVGLAEKSRLGGTCVIRGCVPKKLMSYGAHFSEYFHIAKSYGWQGETPKLNLGELIKNRNAEILRLNGIYKAMLGKAGVQVFEGEARFLSRNADGTFKIETGQGQVSAKRVLIACGGKPQLPEIEGIEHAVTSDSVLEDTYSTPGHVTVVGAGYIGVELASIFNGMGIPTSIVLRKSQPLRGFDQDLRDYLTQGMKDYGLDIKAETVVTKIGKNDSGKIIVHTNHETITTDMLVYATGRGIKAQTAPLNLDAVGLEAAENGVISVDKRFETSVPGIFAVGDCCDHAGQGFSVSQFDLTPVAIAEGRVIAETLYNNNPHDVAYHAIPTAIFSFPQAATVGMTEDQARAAGIDVEIYRTSFRPMFYSFDKGPQKSMMKLIVDRSSDKVLGCAMVGDDSAEIMQGLAIALVAGATKKDFDRTVGIHPSSAEEFVTLYTPGG